MEDEDINVIVQRFFTLLHYTINAKMPRKGGIHIYATGNTFSHMKTELIPYGYRLTISEGVPYSRYAMGYDDNMCKRTPRNGKYSKGLEAINFRVIDSSIRTVSKCLAEVGGVTLDGDSI